MLLKFCALANRVSMSFVVIPAKAGIQCFQGVIKPLDPGFRRGDDFLKCIDFDLEGSWNFC
jgi:hypothetical protein